MEITKARIERFLRRTVNEYNSHVKSSIEGKPIISPLRNGKGLETYWWHSWKTEVIRRLCKVNDRTFIDIGANLGQTLFDHFLADSKTRYIGFEPNPHCIYYLNDLIEKNSLAQYTILPIGLAAEAKIVPLYSQKGHTGDDSATLIKDLRPDWELASQYVPCYKFDDVRETLRLENIGLVKIDVEGAELEVIKGMRESIKAFQPVILCEVLFRDPSADPLPHAENNRELMRILGSLDYSILQLVKTPDDRQVVDARKIDAFDTAEFTEENRLFCDYLFVPTGEQERVVNALLGKKSE